ncbi:anaerobic ribonucleoside-triphosphate reductase [Enterocloster bolteae]|uniref:anaerobic ribonucleoside-triphosphate reductase n=1 Tax=Enterocloster bolteae TaxID=208479 RepID=UPI002A8040A5|nr:anaerobic ribonucleoside-triphosphate reductase [Enterocloster bolteae]
MDINIRLNKNFTTAFNKMLNEYGEEMAKLNGFSDSQLSYTDFIDNFVDKQTVADASIDGNANAGTKDICSLETEMSKPHSKLLAFNKIFYEMNKKYGFKAANDWLRNEWDGHLYLHDAASSTMKPYCFSGDTKILTKNGIKRLDELVDQDILVLNKNHGWENATVKNFGKNVLKKLILERYGVEKEIMVTGNHIWFVRSKNNKISEIETDDLRIGMKIPFNASNVWAHVTPSPFGVAHGFFIGDGDKGEHLRANFCGDKDSLLPYFTPASINGTEFEKTIQSVVPKFFCELPSLNETPSYLYGWLSGYFAADGCVDDKGRCTISSIKHENLEFVRNVLCVLGMPVNEIRYQDRISNITNKPGRVYTLTLSNEYLKDDFFIRPLHKKRWIPSKERKDRNWIVKAVIDTNIEEDVYCAVVDGSKSFTLDNNILTHNCFAYDIEELVNKGLYFIENFNAQPPKHLVTYTDFVGEFVSWTSNRTSGACGLPSFLIYSFYFWKKDVEAGYYTVSPERYRDQEFQRIIYKLNQPYLRINQSAFTNFSIFDHPYMESLFGGKEFPDGTFIIDYIDEIVEYQKRFMEVVSEVRSKNMMTFPVLSFSLLRKNGKFVDEDFAKWCCLHNMKWADSNFFISDDITSLSNCCRLISDVKNLGYFNSIGGSALEVGSIKVNTINLARLSYENETIENYLESLKAIVEIDLQALDCVRRIIKRNIDKGLLPNYTYNVMSMSSQYNTIGIIGIYEALQKYGFTYKDELGNTFYSDDGVEFAKKILKTIHSVKDTFASDKDYQINIEEIPAERAAAILMEKDCFFYPNEIYELPLYGNQWIPLGVKTTLQEKIRLSAILDKACSGGSIAHINLDTPLENFDTAWELLNYIADQGVVYFAFCLRISSCKNNHGFYGNICPYCGELTETTWQRIVGFLTPEKTYSKERKDEFRRRDWFEMDRMREIG